MFLNTEIGINSITEISFLAKHYWNYPSEYYDIWKDELTISEDYINNNKVFVAEEQGEVIGYFSIVKVEDDFFAGKVFVKKGFWLEHIFIKPKCIKNGIGTKLMNFAKNYCIENKIECLNIFSDPNAYGFYERIGAKYIGESLSSIEGRTVSVFVF